jgi:predicted nucleic acid-binding protein
MSAKFFVDTNILMYAHDRSTGEKHIRANGLIQQLWNSGTGVVSTQVLQELCVNIRRKSTRPLSLDETRDLVRDYMDWEVVVNDGDSILEALALERRFSLSFWDALIIHAAERSGAETIYSEDLAHGQVYGSTRVVNPFFATAL